MQLTLHWKTNSVNTNAIDDDNLDYIVDLAVNNRCTRVKEEAMMVSNMLVVDAFRVQRKLGKLTGLNLEHNGNYYRVDADGRWQDILPSSLFLMDKYLIQLI